MISIKNPSNGQSTSAMAALNRECYMYESTWPFFDIQVDVHSKLKSQKVKSYEVKTVLDSLSKDSTKLIPVTGLASAVWPLVSKQLCGGYGQLASLNVFLIKTASGPKIVTVVWNSSLKQWRLMFYNQRCEDWSCDVKIFFR